MGGQNVLTGKVEGHGGGVIRVRAPSGSTFEVPLEGPPPTAGEEMSIALRRDHVDLVRADSDNAGKGVNEIAGAVTATEYQGSYVKVLLDDIGGDGLVAYVPDRIFYSDPLAIGDVVMAGWSTEKARMLA
jgi:putative spermidine/putrescine transport system ATP-binding protein